MLKPAVRPRAGKPSRRSSHNVPTRSHVVAVNEYRFRDPSARDDSDGVRPTRADLFDLKGCQTELVETERRDQFYRIDERSSDDNRQRQRIFAGNKIPDRLPALPSSLQSRTRAGSQHVEKQIGRWPGNPA